MVGKKKRVKAMKGKRVKAMGGKNVGMGKRVTAKKGKRVKAMKGKRVKARGGNKIQKLAEGGDVGMFQIKPDETATEFLKRIQGLKKKFPEVYKKANEAARKRMQKPTVVPRSDDVKAATGGKIKKAGARVKARGGNKIQKLAKGTTPGGIGAAASSAAEKESKDRGTERANKAKKYKSMTKERLVALLLGTLGTAAR